MAEFSYQTHNPTLIVRTSSGRLFAVCETGNPDLAHVWTGFEVKRQGVFFTRKAKARDILVCKAGATIIDR